jgi:hypothetical protein
MRTRWLLLLAALVVAACSLPQRDNAFDPANAPAAQLAVLRLAGPGSTCPPPIATVPEAVGSASRGDCLELDAGASQDPHGDRMRFRFSALGSAGFEPLGVESTASTLVLLRSLVFGLSSAGEATFAVAVTDGHGGHGETTRTIALLDARPDAGKQASRALPLGGYPWNPGAPIPIDFRPDGAGDADGDAPSYCWSFPASLANDACTIAPGPDGICSANAADSCFTRQVDVSGGVAFEATATLVVRDGPRASDRASLPVPAIVDVREPNLWAGPGGNIPGTRIERLDAARVPVAGYRDYPHVDFLAAQSAMAVIDRPVNDYQLTMASWPSAAPLGTPMPFPAANVAGVRTDAASSRLWLFETDLPPGIGLPASAAVHAWTVGAGGALTPGIDVSLSVPYTGAQGEVAIEIDTAGDAWIGRFGGFAQIVEAHPDGTLRTVDAGTDHVFQSLAARPGAGEVWAVRTMSAPTGTGSPFESAKLVSFDATGLESDYDLALGGESIDFASGFAWIDRNEAWLAVPAIGLLHVDVPTLVATGSLDEALLGRVDVVNVASRLTVDPVTGAVWAVSASAGVVRATRSGTLTTFAYADSYTPDRVDPAGRLWSASFLPDPTLLAGESPARSGVVETTDVLFSLFPQPDLASGGLWTTSIVPPSILHLAQDMTSLRQVSSFRLDGGTATAMPMMLPARFEPGSQTAWAIGRGGTITTSLGLFRIDFSADPPIARTILGATQAADLEILEASAPIPGTQPFAWGLTRSTGQVIMIDPSGNVSPVFTLPAAERDFGSVFAKAARSLFSNKLCLGTLDTSSGSTVLHLRRFSPTGTVETLGTITMPVNFDFPAAAAATGPGEDACLFAWDDLADGDYANMTSNVSGWLSPAKPLGTATLTGGQFSSLVATSPERFSVSMLRPAPGETAPSVYVDRFAWNGASYDRIELDAAAFVVLVAPDAQNRRLP